MGNKQDEDFMRRAIELSRKARIVDRVGNCFGCVIVKDGEIVSEGYNQVGRVRMQFARPRFGVSCTHAVAFADFRTS